MLRKEAPPKNHCAMFLLLTVYVTQATIANQSLIPTCHSDGRVDPVSMLLCSLVQFRSRHAIQKLARSSEVGPYSAALWAPCVESMAELCSQAMVRYGQLFSEKEKWQAVVSDAPLSPDWVEQLAEVQEPVCWVLPCLGGSYWAVAEFGIFLLGSPWFLFDPCNSLR